MTRQITSSTDIRDREEGLKFLESNYNENGRQAFRASWSSFGLWRVRSCEYAVPDFDFVVARFVQSFSLDQEDQYLEFWNKYVE